MRAIDEDIDYLVREAKRLGLTGKTFLVTGATGMIGRMLVFVLTRITDERKIYALGLNVEETKAVFCDSNINKLGFETIDSIQANIDYVIHLASPTNSTFLKEKPVEVISFIYESTKHILDFASKHRSKVLYVSSMESYGIVVDDAVAGESDLGYLSLTNTRNSYPETKRLCELLCYSYANEYKLSVCTVRLAQTFGAGTIKDDPRVFGYFARCALNNENIVLKTKGDSYGNYCYLADTLCAFFYVLIKGVSGETYNVVGDDCRCTILELAKLVAEKISKSTLKIEFDYSDNNMFPKPTKLNMSNAKLKGLGWQPVYRLSDMFERMIENWKNDAL